MTESIHVAVVDDQSLFRYGVRQAFDKADGISVIAEGENAMDAIRIAKLLAPDLILLDIDAPGSSITAVRTISQAHPDIKVLLLTASESKDEVSAAMQCGAIGYVQKTISGPDLVQKVRSILDIFYVASSPAIGTHNGLHAKREPGQRLTAREEEILELVAEGLTNREIARQLDIKENTVKNRMTMIMRKLHVHSRVKALLKHHGRR